MKDKVKYGHELLDIEIPKGLTSASCCQSSTPPHSLGGGDRGGRAGPSIGAGLLAEEIHAGDTVCILTNDITRLTRSHIYIPILVRELNKAGVPDGDITILFADGMHSAMTESRCAASSPRIFTAV